MFERLLEQKEAVTTVLCPIGKPSLCLSEEEWSMITLSIEALKPFEEVTREISTEKHVSVSKVIPLVSLFLRSTASNDCQGSNLAAEHTMSTSFQRYCKLFMALLSVTTWTQDLKTWRSLTWQMLNL